MAKVTVHKDDDPSLEEATKRAKATFRYFWRELSWEYRRIIPGLDLAAFKAAFTDDDQTSPEIMWVNEVDFDGYTLSGRLLNQPNWLKSIQEGDEVKIPRKALVDWMYAIQGKPYGGFTVHAIRKQLSKSDRKQHDDAWGFDFGNPDQVHMVPPEWYDQSNEKKGFLGKLFRGTPEPLTDDVLQAHEHPMAANMEDSLKEFAEGNPEAIHEIGDNGLNMLHQLALAGTATGLKALLDVGADVHAKSKRGHTALEFAKSMGWKRAAKLLHQYEQQ